VVLAAVASVFTTGVADLGWRDVDGASEAASLAIAQDPGVAQRVVKLGSRGEEVTAVERRLDELGFDVKVDRYFDRGTDRAVRRFQHDKGLRVDGVVGRATWHALFARESGAQSAPGEGNYPRDDTELAVRIAASKELSQDDLEKLGLPGPSLGPDRKGDGALVAIEIPDRLTPRDSTHRLGNSGEDLGASGSATPSLETPNAAESSSADPSQAPKAPAPSPASGASVCGSERLIAPVRGAVLTSSYRTPRRRNHAGVDLAAPSGTPIRAVACGVVSFLQGTAQTGGYGNLICVKHSSRFTTCYAHLSRFSDERVGDLVRQGEVIGYVGSTGRSTGPHLHFETRSGNPYGRNDFDPAPYLAGRAIPGTRVSVPSIGGPDLEPAQLGGALTGLVGVTSDGRSPREAPAEDSSALARSYPSTDPPGNEVMPPPPAVSGPGGPVTGESPGTQTSHPNSWNGGEIKAEGDTGENPSSDTPQPAPSAGAQGLPAASNGAGDDQHASEGGIEDKSEPKDDTEGAGSQEGASETGPPPVDGQTADVDSETLVSASSADTQGITPSPWTPASPDWSPCWPQRCPW
jgi:murein DD-endopeptidase MepM/ murein hydrolase activator NlpD